MNGSSQKFNTPSFDFGGAGIKKFSAYFCKGFSLPVFLLCGFSLVAGPSETLAAPPMLKTSGNQIVTASGGCTLRLHGVNYSGTEYNPTGQPAGNMIDRKSTRLNSSHL